MRSPLFIVILTILAPLSVFGQISKGGLPASLRPEWATQMEAQRPSPLDLALPNLDAIRAEDDQATEQARFAAPMQADVSPATAGQWTQLADGTRVWRCTVRGDRALALVLLFDQFRLPAGAEFFAYTTSPVQRIHGAYTAESCNPEGVFTIGPIYGESATLEYILPPNATDEGAIHLNRVDYGYHLGALIAGDPAAALDFGNSLSCHVNVNCPEGTAWQTQKRGVARILMVFGNGSAWCSGSLIANKTGSGIPYFLTAHHCQILLNNPQFSQWAFHFDYEASGCNNPATEPAFKSVLGCQRIAWRDGTDFLLLRLSPIPPSYNLYFNGWSRLSTPPTTSTFVHHPQGDIKKISHSDQLGQSHTQVINWGGQFGQSQPNTHWRIIPTTGIYEPGSSGCPLFNADKLIMGQLHGGVANQCSVTASYFGMFHHSWEQGFTTNSRLREWLDPNNAGGFTQAGYPQPPGPFSIGGKVSAAWGPSMPNLLVTISGPNGFADTTMTDTLGNYKFVDLLPNLSYTLKVISPNDHQNGVSTVDLLRISQHILNLVPLPSPYTILAADANGSNTVTSFDIVEARKVILQVAPEFPIPSWRFLPASFQFPNPLNPFESPIPIGLIVTNLSSDVTNAHFTGIKVGDMNNSATTEP
jgi:lysyl endopeptidase